jgi:hypothetical protein
VRRAAKVDENHVEIVTALRGRGASVLSLAALGRGVPDLAVSVHGYTFLAEIKAHREGTVAGEPNPAQRKWIDEWRGPVVVIRSLEDVGRVVEMAKARSEAVELMR